MPVVEDRPLQNFGTRHAERRGLHQRHRGHAVLANAGHIEQRRQDVGQAAKAVDQFPVIAIPSDASKK